MEVSNQVLEKQEQILEEQLEKKLNPEQYCRESKSLNNFGDRLGLVNEERAGFEIDVGSEFGDGEGTEKGFVLFSLIYDGIVEYGALAKKLKLFKKFNILLKPMYPEKVKALAMENMKQQLPSKILTGKFTTIYGLIKKQE